MYYSRLCRTTKDRGTLIPTEEILEHIDDYETDWYESIFQYNEVQFQQFLETKTVAGILDVTTSKLVFDLDSKDNLEAARQDAITLVTRLQADISLEAIQIYFSGKKGFTVVVETNQRFTPTQLRSVCLTKYGKDLKTLDEAIYNASRILRVPHTKHQETGLYKIDISPGELGQTSIEDIKKYAESIGSVEDYEIAQLSNSFVPKEFVIKKDLHIEKATDKFLDLTLKPAYLTNCKYAILHGHFSEGFRTLSLLYLGATYKNQGFPLEVTYRLLKGSAELQAQKHNNDRLPDEEIYQIVSQVYGPNWKGGQGSCRPGTRTEDLRSFCQSLGEYACVHDEKTDGPIYVTDLKNIFKHFVQNVDSNTVKTGIAELDDNIFMCTGSNIGLIGASGSGKTSLALNILNNNSKNGVKTVFASFDMSRTRIYEKILYKVTGLPRQKLYQTYANNQEADIEKKVKEEFGNVFIMQKTCPSVNDLGEFILNCEHQSGEKVKLVVIDYFERIMSEYADETQSSKKIAGELQDLVENLNVCLITLVQPNKNALSGGLNSPIYDYTKIKGSSFIYQSFRQIISLWRPGYNPENNERDKFMRIAVIKNDLGELSSKGFHWDGKRGEITSLNDSEVIELEELENENEEEENNTYTRFMRR